VWQPLIQKGASAFLCILRFLLAMLRFASLRMFLSCEAFFLYLGVFVNFLLINSQLPFLKVSRLMALDWYDGLCVLLLLLLSKEFLFALWFWLVVNSDRSVQCSAVVLVVCLIHGKASFFNLNLKNMPEIIIRRTCLSMSQSVASEAIEVFVLFNFNLVGLAVRSCLSTHHPGYIFDCAEER